MNHPLMPSVTAALAAAGSFLLLAFGLIPSVWLLSHPVRRASFGAKLAGIAAFSSLLADVGLAIQGPVHQRIAIGRIHCLTIHFDALTAVLLTLISFLLAMVMRYSVNYLAGNPGQNRFTRWLSLTGASVLAIVFSGNLIQFALAWSATSLCLHQLLTFFPHRPGALLAARKKFLMSRAGDLCLLAVIVLVRGEFGTWDFQSLFAAAKAAAQSGPTTSAVHAICFLLVTGACLKSAQFPFHSWLPDTMETPTPVSALMHAGIINAGGFLILRLSPLIVLSPPAQITLATLGAFTALFGSLVMLTHASVKRSLAFSTVAQMGFMMLECGLGAFSLAVLHLVAHSLYKAHAFLSSGSLSRLARSSWVANQPAQSQWTHLLLAIGTAALVTVGTAGFFNVGSSQKPGNWLLSGILFMAISHFLMNLWKDSLNSRILVTGIGLAMGLCGVYFTLELLFSGIIPESPASVAFRDGTLGSAWTILLLGLFAVTLLVHTELPSKAGSPLFRAIYVHARNGFYFNTLANQTVEKIWPVKTPESFIQTRDHNL